jgi:hypothetical protein
LPSPEAHELALLLVRKAEGDESILDRLLDDHDVPGSRRLVTEKQVPPPKDEAGQADHDETSAAPG